MQKRKYQDMSNLNFYKGMCDFDNMQHTSIEGFPRKNFKYYDIYAIGPTVLHINFAKKNNKFGYEYHLSNNYRIFEDFVGLKFQYDSIDELFLAIKSFGESYITKNFTNSKKMVNKLNEMFDNKQQGFLPIF